MAASFLPAGTGAGEEWIDLYCTGKNRTAIYAGESCWGYAARMKNASEAPTAKEQVEQCCEFLESRPNFTLTRIYRDYGGIEVDGGKAWKKMLDDVERRKLDTVMVASIRCIGQTYYFARHYIERFLIPAGVRFIDIKENFDSKTDSAEDYYRRTFAAYRYWTRMVIEPGSRPASGKKRGRPPKIKEFAEPQEPKKRGRPPKVKTLTEDFEHKEQEA